MDFRRNLVRELIFRILWLSGNGGSRLSGCSWKHKTKEVHTYKGSQKTKDDAAKRWSDTTHPLFWSLKMPLRFGKHAWKSVVKFSKHHTLHNYLQIWNRWDKLYNITTEAIARIGNIAARDYAGHLPEGMSLCQLAVLSHNHLTKKLHISSVFPCLLSASHTHAMRPVSHTHHAGNITFPGGSTCSNMDF